MERSKQKQKYFRVNFLAHCTQQKCLSCEDIFATALILALKSMCSTGSSHLSKSGEKFAYRRASSLVVTHKRSYAARVENPYNFGECLSLRVESCRSKSKWGIEGRNQLIKEKIQPIFRSLTITKQTYGDFGIQFGKKHSMTSRFY